jgi:hypothetical protein
LGKLEQALGEASEPKLGPQFRAVLGSKLVLWFQTRTPLLLEKTLLVEPAQMLVYLYRALVFQLVEA